MGTDIEIQPEKCLVCCQPNCTLGLRGGFAIKYGESLLIQTCKEHSPTSQLLPRGGRGLLYMNTFIMFSTYFYFNNDN